jgi:cytochrome P450
MNLTDTDSRIPPGPDAPVEFGIDPETLERLKDLQSAYGNIVAVTKPNGRRAFFINDAAEVRRLLVRHHSRYRKGPGFERVKMLLGNGLIVSDGDVWRRSRRMIQPAFTRQNVHRLIGLMIECAQDRAAMWRPVAEAGGTLDITQEMSDFALRSPYSEVRRESIRVSEQGFGTKPASRFAGAGIAGAGYERHPGSACARR